MVDISCLTICNLCMSLCISYGRNDPRAKRPTGETTHLIRANRPTPKTRAKRPRAKRPGETTQGRNDLDSFLSIELSIEICSFVPFCRMHCFLSASIAYSIIFQTVLLEPFIFALCLSICQHIYKSIYRHIFTLCRLSDVKVCL